jgi:hypothetical protein
MRRKCPFHLRAVALVMPQLASVAHLALAAGVCRAAWRSVIGSEAEVNGRIPSKAKPPDGRPSWGDAMQRTAVW